MLRQRGPSRNKYWRKLGIPNIVTGKEPPVHIFGAELKCSGLFRRNSAGEVGGYSASRCRRRNICRWGCIAPALPPGLAVIGIVRPSPQRCLLSGLLVVGSQHVSDSGWLETARDTDGGSRPSSFGNRFQFEVPLAGNPRLRSLASDAPWFDWVFISS